MRRLKNLLFWAAFLLLFKVIFELVFRAYLLMFPDVEFLDKHRNKALIIQHAAQFSLKFTTILMVIFFLLLIGLPLLKKKRR